VASGIFAGSAALALASHDADLADRSLTTAPVTLTGTVDAYATADIALTSGPGVLTHTGDAYALDLGIIGIGAPPVVLGFDVANVATGLADTLRGSFTVPAASSFTNAGFTAFNGLASGQADVAPSVTLATGTGGVFSETITVHATGSNASGYVSPAQDLTLTINGTIACFAAGTLIRTEAGDVAVERLCPGDRVLTLRGAAIAGGTLGSGTSCPSASRPARSAPGSPSGTYF